MTQEEKQMAMEFILKYNRIFSRLDSIQKQIDILKKESENAQEEIESVREAETTFIQDLREKYGDIITANYLLEAMKEKDNA